MTTDNHSRTLSTAIRELTKTWYYPDKIFVDKVDAFHSIVGDGNLLRDEIHTYASDARKDVTPSGQKVWGYYCHSLKKSLTRPALTLQTAIDEWLVKQNEKEGKELSYFALKLIGAVSERRAKDELRDVLTPKKMPTPISVIEAAKRLRNILTTIQEIVIEETGFGPGVPTNPDLIAITEQVQSSPVTTTDTNNQTELSHPEIAILHHINGWIIHPGEADIIAKKYGQNSGQRLMIEYENLADEEVRTGKGRFRKKNYINIGKLVLDKYKAQYNKELNKVLNSNKK